jgi:hypothetical protein
MRELIYIFAFFVAVIVATASVYMVFAIYFTDLNFMQWPEPTSGNFWYMFFQFNVVFAAVRESVLNKVDGSEVR